MTKIVRKKLTDAGAASCVFSFLAMLAAVCGTLAEFIGTQICSEMIGQDTDHILAGTPLQYFAVYGGCVTMAAVSLTVFVICAACRRKKKLGAEFGGILAVFSLTFGAFMAARSLYMYNDLKGTLDMSFGDFRDFYSLMILLSTALPLISCLLLFLCGLLLWGRAVTDDFAVKCPVMVRQPAEPVDNDEEPAYGGKGQKTADEIAPSIEYTNSNYQKEQLFKTQENDDPPAEQTDAEVQKPIIPNLPEMMLCPDCGTKNRIGVKFCRGCGHKFT